METPFREDDLHYQLEKLDTSSLMHLVFLQVYYKVCVN